MAPHLFLSQSELEHDGGAIIEQDLADVRTPRRQAPRADGEDPLLIRRVPAELRAWRRVVHARAARPRSGPDEIETRHHSRCPNGNPVGIAHAELGGNGSPLIPHVGAVRVDWRENGVSHVGIARLSRWRV